MKADWTNSNSTGSTKLQCTQDQTNRQTWTGKLSIQSVAHAGIVGFLKHWNE